MHATWMPVHSMERFIDHAVAAGIEEHDLSLARCVIALARVEPPTDTESSLILWERVCAYGLVRRYPMDAYSIWLASMVWREGHTMLREPRSVRRWWRRQQPVLAVTAHAWPTAA
jgi:hypothetical protein